MTSVETIGLALALVGTVAGVVSTWITYQQFLDSKKLPTVDDFEIRILRALINEPNGRILGTYRSVYDYQEALKRLQNKELIHKGGDKFFLTETGTKVVKQHLRKFMNRRK